MTQSKDDYVLQFSTRIGNKIASDTDCAEFIALGDIVYHRGWMGLGRPIFNGPESYSTIYNEMKAIQNIVERHQRDDRLQVSSAVRDNLNERLTKIQEANDRVRLFTFPFDSLLKPDKIPVTFLRKAAQATVEQTRPPSSGAIANAFDPSQIRGKRLYGGMFSFDWEMVKSWWPFGQSANEKRLAEAAFNLYQASAENVVMQNIKAAAAEAAGPPPARTDTKAWAEWEAKAKRLSNEAWKTSLRKHSIAVLVFYASDGGSSTSNLPTTDDPHSPQYKEQLIDYITQKPLSRTHAETGVVMKPWGKGIDGKYHPDYKRGGSYLAGDPIWQMEGGARFAPQSQALGGYRSPSYSRTHRASHSPRSSRSPPRSSRSPPRSARSPPRSARSPRYLRGAF